MSKEIDKKLKSLLTACAEINKKYPGKVDAHGTIECPECKGKLLFHKNSYNGHIWGKCETKDCLSWMQ